MASASSSMHCENIFVLFPSAIYDIIAGVSLTFFDRSPRFFKPSYLLFNYKTLPCKPVLLLMASERGLLSVEKLVPFCDLALQLKLLKIAVPDRCPSLLLASGVAD